MKRRQFIHLASSLGAAMSIPAHAQSSTSQSGKNRAASKAAPDEKADILQLQQQMQGGQLSSVGLCRFYLERIKRIDQHGPTLRSVLELNPEALAIAASMDAERKAGKVRGPLHGIPVLLKDNIATADKMKSSAGSLAIAHFPADRDAHIVAQLRAAGAVILGKTNLSEWANFRSTHAYSGWSARGGLTRNPYVLDRNASGSSSGSGAAAAAHLAVLCIGTETDGSIVSPASVCGVVGLKPTVGLLSRAGIVPIAASQDTAGPMTRNVMDAALAMSAMASADKDDAATLARPAGLVTDFAAGLNKDGLRGVRIGVVRSMFGNHPQLTARINEALEVMRAQGAIIVDPVELTPFDLAAELDVLLNEFKHGLNQYLPRYASREPVQTLAQVIAWNRAHAKQELAVFDQDIFERAESSPGVNSEGYLKAHAACLKATREDGIDRTLKQHQLDALLAPTGDPAWLTDVVNGDRTGTSFSSHAAIAGYPHVSVPCGLVQGLPVSVSFVGTAWRDAALLKMAYAYEQASLLRQAPKFLATLATSQ